MKSVRNIVSLFILLLAFPGIGWAFSEDWYACKTASDCAQVDASCGCGGSGVYDKNKIGVNKNYKDEYTKSANALCGVKEPPYTVFSKKGLEHHCDVAGSDWTDPRSEVDCLENKCVSIDLH